MLRTMGGSTEANPQSRALGTALRAAREATGETLRSLARRLGVTPAALSRWESGSRQPRVEDVSALLGALGVTGAERDQLLGLARNTNQPRWLPRNMSEQQQQLATLLHYEQHAKLLVNVSPFIPGLLQTGDYARAVMRESGVPNEEIDTRVAIRLGRRDVLRNGTVRLQALIGEPALRQEVGGHTVFLGQLESLMEMAAWETVELRIIPYSAGWHAAFMGPFVLVERTDGPPIVHIESLTTSLFLHEREDTTPYIVAAEKIRKLAMPPKESMGLIDSIITEQKESTRP